jgi:hypothetical protein
MTDGPFVVCALLFGCRLFRLGGRLLLGLVGKFGLSSFGCLLTGCESVDTTFGVDDFLFTRKERVRRATDVYLDEWVFVAVFPLDGVICLRSALRQKRKLRHIVAKYDRAVIGWVNTAFHICPTIHFTERNV